MKSPSTLCLQALRHIALSNNCPQNGARLSRRCYASTQDKKRTPPPLPPPRAFKPPPPPPAPKRQDIPPAPAAPKQLNTTPPATAAQATTTVTPEPTSKHTSTPPPPPSATTIEERPPQQAFDLRSNPADQDGDFIPLPLSRPIGLASPPLPGENTGLDRRTVRQRRDDFVDYDKHLARRAKMTKQISKPYFRDWSNMRFSKGKVFVAPGRLFRVESALFFPNLFGRVLRKGGERGRGGRVKDGYGGLGRDTCEVMYGKASVVTYVSNAWAVGQVDTFCSPVHNSELSTLLSQAPDVAQMVEINYEPNVLKYWLLRLFGLPRLRSERSLEQQGRYFIVRRGINDRIKEAIGLMNDSVGYVYLVDAECRIRWAGSAVAEEHEKGSLVRGVKKLIFEARAVNEKPVLEEAVAEVVNEKRAAAGGG